MALAGREGGRVMLWYVRRVLTGCRAPQEGETPLMLAAREGDLEVARELISKGADIEARDKVREAEGAIDECCGWRLVEREREREAEGGMLDTR